MLIIININVIIKININFININVKINNNSNNIKTNITTNNNNNNKKTSTVTTTLILGYIRKSMRFKANSDSPGSKSLLSGEGQRARPEKEISANNADLEREKK